MPENLMSKISATPVRRPIAASMPSILNFNACGGWPRNAASMFFASDAA